MVFINFTSAKPLKRFTGTAGVPPENEREARKCLCELFRKLRLRRVCGRDARGPRKSLDRNAVSIDSALPSGYHATLHARFCAAGIANSHSALTGAFYYSPIKIYD